MTLLPKIKRRNIYEQVVEHLQRYIITNSLQPGDRLPTELELADQFGVSRHSVREAVKVLESAGIIETSPRTGSRVKEVSTRHLTEHLKFLLRMEGVSIKEIASARQIIETGILPMVVQNAEESDFQRMEAAIEHERELTQKGLLDVDAELEFHQAIAEASKNRVMVGLGGMLREFFTHLRHVPPNMEAQWKSIEEHTQIYQALRQRDAVTAQMLMHRHLSIYNQYTDEDLM